MYKTSLVYLIPSNLYLSKIALKSLLILIPFYQSRVVLFLNSPRVLILYDDILSIFIEPIRYSTLLMLIYIPLYKFYSSSLMF